MIDLDKFPTSEAAKRMLKRVAPVYGSSYFLKNLYQAMGLEWDEARELVLGLRDQLFTETVTWGIEYQEHKYSITPDESLSLEERRARLKRRTQQKFPLSPGILEQYIKNGWGLDVDVDETVAPGYIKLVFDDGITESIGDAIAEIRKIKPSHLSLHAALEISKELPFPLGMASPVSNIREVRLEPLKQGICLPFGIGFLAEEECTGTRAAFPKSAHEGMFIGIRHSKLLPRSVRAQGGHIDIPDRMGDKHLELAFGTLLWMPSGAVQNRLPSGAGTGLFVALRVSPMAGNAVQAAPPGNTARGSLFVGLLHTALLPRHVNASGTLPPPEAFPQEGRLGIRVGMAVHGDPMREVLPTFPRGASARSSVGVLAGEVLWHVNSRKE